MENHLSLPFQNTKRKNFEKKYVWLYYTTAKIISILFFDYVVNAMNNFNSTFSLILAELNTVVFLLLRFTFHKYD